jgi:hypothetical protein
MPSKMRAYSGSRLHQEELEGVADRELIAVAAHHEIADAIQW